jgi:putative chitinase
MITDDELRQVMPQLPAGKRALYLPFLQKAMEEFGINSYLRKAAFLGQLAHESGQLKFMEEIWGPTSFQRNYEPPNDTARRLGNTQPGDGKRFKGRGPIQLTGRDNYGRFGALLGEDLVGNPERAATPEVGFRIAGLYWKSRGLNELADQPDYREITVRINGRRCLGWEDRVKYYEKAKAVLSRERSQTGRGEGREVPPGLSRGILPGDEELFRPAAAQGVGAKKAGAKRPAAKKQPARAAAKKGAAKSRAKPAVAKKSAKPPARKHK